MTKVLIVVDVQRDFCKGGALAVEDGDEVVDIINELTAAGGYDLIIATRDWHPADHISFAVNHGQEPFTMKGENMLWPVHCVAETIGASFHPRLDLSRINIIVNKGMQRGQEEYSAFQSLPLDKLIPEGSQIDVIGLATDYCVAATAHHAKSVPGSKVRVLLEACRGVSEDTTLKAIESLKKCKVEIV